MFKSSLFCIRPHEDELVKGIEFPRMFNYDKRFPGARVEKVSVHTNDYIVLSEQAFKRLRLCKALTCNRHLEITIVYRKSGVFYHTDAKSALLLGSNYIDLTCDKEAAAIKAAVVLTKVFDSVAK